MDALLGNADDYGSYEALGNLSVHVAVAGQAQNYRRALDLETGIHTTQYSINSTDFLM